jgi:two-component system phosphate regulon sensor histidine kinase PhoR
VDAKVTDAGGALHTELMASAHLIQADPVHFTNVLDNLLDNALKYSPENPQVTVSTANPSPDVLIISIRDNGIGIAKNFQKKVFNKFFRVPTGNIHNVKGFGLGLYYVRNICQQHGWKIQLDSEPGKGTTVQITIPQATRPTAIPSKERVA